MKKILIISPHYPPSNLAAVHRSRLFAQHLPALGWEPIILTVDEKYYEETLDWKLHQLLPAGQHIEKVKAFRVTQPRLIGDIGLRAFYQLRKKALQLVKEENIGFVYIPIPSFYVSLIGPYLHRKTGVKYGIDYIDPWVHKFPGSNKLFSRHWFSTKLAKFLEPIAVKKASLITGVAEGYYKGVQERNPQLLKNCLFGAMPYGGEQADHSKVKGMGLKPYLFEKDKEKIQLVYAGAFLPKSAEPLKAIFRSIASNRDKFEKTVFHFIGTGRNVNNRESYTIRTIAQEFGLWDTIIKEYPARISYLDVLIHLDAADGVFILGSTEPHYTPSKVYQGVLSGKPVMAVLHKNSSAGEVIRQSGAGIVLSFNGEEGIKDVEFLFISHFEKYRELLKIFTPADVNKEVFQLYSAYSITKKLVTLVNNCVI